MKRKVGDTVVIHGKKWIERQEKNEINEVISSNRDWVMNLKMQSYAGQKAIIKEIKEDYYKIDIDGGEWSWQDWMFKNPKKWHKWIEEKPEYGRKIKAVWVYSKLDKGGKWRYIDNETV